MSPDDSFTAQDNSSFITTIKSEWYISTPESKEQLLKTTMERFDAIMTLEENNPNESDLLSKVVSELTDLLEKNPSIISRIQEEWEANPINNMPISTFGIDQNTYRSVLEGLPEEYKVGLNIEQELVKSSRDTVSFLEKLIEKLLIDSEKNSKNAKAALDSLRSTIYAFIPFGGLISASISILRLTKGFKIFESKVTTAISHTISKAVKSDSELQTKFKDFLLEILGGEKSL